MKESVSNVLRWVSLPFVFFGVFTLVHIIAMLLNGSSISRMSYDGGPLPILPMLIITFFAGAISAGAAIYSCSAVAPNHKRTVVWSTGIFCVIILLAGTVLSAIAHGWGMDLLRTIVDNIGAIIGSVFTMKSLLEEDLS